MSKTPNKVKVKSFPNLRGAYANERQVTLALGTNVVSVLASIRLPFPSLFFVPYFHVNLNLL